MNIREKEEAILAEYCKIAKKRHEKYVVKDGLPFCGKIIMNGCNWERTPGDEEIVYQRMPLKILLITKECPESSETEDLRTESFRVNNTQNGGIETIDMLFHHNILSTIWGLTHYSNIQKRCPYWDDKENPWTWDMARKLFETAPIPRINVKKTAGNNISNPTTLRSYMYDVDYRPLITKQILLYDADIIVCCGYSDNIEESGSLLLNFLKNECYPSLNKLDDNWIYFDEDKNKIAINNWHLSSRMGSEEWYNQITSAYHRFLEKHPNFIKSHRK